MGRQVTARLLGPLLLAALAGGCRFSLPDDLYQLHGVDGRCAEPEEEALAERVRGFDPTTPSDELTCALWQLRALRPSDIHQTAAAAKVCYLLADRHLGSTDRERLAAEGVRWAEIALDGAPAVALYGIAGDDTPEEGRVSYYLAINLGIAVHDHTALAIKNLKRLDRELTKAVRLCPDEEQGGPLRVLGLLYLVAPPWPQGIGDGDKALALLEQAAKQYPGHPLNHVFYAQALCELEGDDSGEEVRRQLEIGNRLLEEGRWGEAKQRWRKLLEDLAREANVKLLPL